MGSESENDFTVDCFDSWHVYGCNELLLPPKPPNYLVDGLIRHPSVTCFYGPPGGLKTMLMLDLYVCIASGQPWLISPPLQDVKSYQVRQGPVFILDQENGVDRLRERVGALCRGRGIDTIPIYGLSIPNPSFNAYNLSHINRLANQLTEVGAVFCVIDSLSAVSGGVEENSSSMAVIMRNLRTCSEVSGATLAIIHHPRKGSSTETGGREGDRLRGHSSIEASLDTAIYVDRKGNTLILKTTKTRDDPWPQLQIEWNYTVDENRALLRGWFLNNGIIQPESSKYAGIHENLPKILKDMGELPSKSKLCQRLQEVYDLKRNQGLLIIESGVRQGVLIEEITGTSKTCSKRYRLPSC